jgi:hypothetical protein
MARFRRLIITLFPLILMLSLSTLRAEEEPEYPAIPNAGKFRAPPRNHVQEAYVAIQWSEIIEECPPEKICVHGEIANEGKSTATRVRMRVDIGATKITKPRASFIRKLDESVMEPGDHQDFSITIDRKITVTENNKTKTIEVGKFNFQITPVWLEQKKDKRT